jgi:MFS superfamily sulfate permease-like transporter
VACLGVLMFGTLQGILVAIIVSLIGLSSQAAFPRMYVIGRKRGKTSCSFSFLIRELDGGRIFQEFLDYSRHRCMIDFAHERGVSE